MSVLNSRTLALIFVAISGHQLPGAQAALPSPKTITEQDCTASKLGSSIPANAIGEPVSAVTLAAPQWHVETATVPAYCGIEGAMAPVDQSETARPIRFGVAFPASWKFRSAHLGGGGMNGIIPRLTSGATRSGAPLLSEGFVTFGSDSGHQMGNPSNPASDQWTLNAEAIANLGYMQLKKTHDAAMILMERMYGQRPRFSYFFGGSQGGREALTVVQRYPADYDGVAAEVPIVNFSSLMLAPELIRIQEKPLSNWVTPAKVNTIRAEFLRQCDKLDGLVDGVINNYNACRTIFSATPGEPNRNPWASKRCPGNVDPNPQDASENACLTDGQIATLRTTYSPYNFATPLANGVKSFGMWVPNTDPSGSGLIAGTRFRGQEGAAPDAPLHRHLGVLGVTGFLMRELGANPLDYVEGGSLNNRRIELSKILDSTNPDLAAFSKRGKLIIVIGSNDTLASPGAQLDYYQSVLDKMGRAGVDSFARFFVLPQTGHGLSGTNHSVDGDGKTIPVQPIPNAYDRLGLIVDWVENGKAPGKSVTVKAGERSLPMCSYPEYPRYVNGPPATAASYTCTPPNALPAQPELVGTVPYSSGRAPVQSIAIQVGDGGSGLYKSVLVGDPNLPTHTLYRPRDLKPFGPNLKLPIVAYGNGACRNSSHEVKNLLTEIASHGFLIVAIGPALSSATGVMPLAAAGTKSAQLLDAVDWAIAENARTGSDYYGKVDTSKIAVMGQSCGGLQAIEVSGDPRITTTVMLNSGILNTPLPPRAGLSGMPNVVKDQLARLHAPIAYFVGGKSDIAYPNAADDVAKISVPVFFANQEVGHYPATYLEPRGGAFGQAASAWLKWQLKGDKRAASMFKGDKCGLCTEPKWTVEKKKIDQ